MMKLVFGLFALSEWLISMILWSSIWHYLNFKPELFKTSLDLVYSDTVLIVISFLTVNNLAFGLTMLTEPLQLWPLRKCVIFLHLSLLYLSLTFTMLTFFLRYLHVFHFARISLMPDKKIQSYSRFLCIGVTIPILIYDCIGHMPTLTFFETSLNGSLEVSGEEKPGIGVIFLVSLLIFSAISVLSKIRNYDDQTDKEVTDFKNAVKFGLVSCVIFSTYFGLILSQSKNYLSLGVLSLVVTLIALGIPFMIIKRHGKMRHALKKKIKRLIFTSQL